MNMNNCNNKIKQSCTKTFAVCSEYQGSISENSPLFEETCLDTQQVIEDIYGLIDVIKEDIDVTELENTCITFTEPKTASSVIEQMYAKICSLEELITDQSILIVTMQEQIENLQENNCP